MHDGIPYGRNQGQGQGHSREVDRQSPTGLIFFYSSQRILFLKFVGILKFVKIREFLEFLKFIKFVFSNYGLDAASPSIVTYSGMY